MHSVVQQVALVSLKCFTGLVLALAVWVLWNHCTSLLTYRHIPGPVPLPFFGNALSFRGVTLPEQYKVLRDKYGSVFRWFLGKQVMVVVSDLELVRLICVKHFHVFHDRWFVLPPVDNKRIKVVQSGMLLAKGKYWASMRAAVQPLFHTSGLSSYAKVMNQAAARVADLLQPVADKDLAVDITDLLGAMTMDVVGSCAFGVELNALAASSGEAPSKLLAAAMGLVDAAGLMLVNVLVFLPALLHGPITWLLAATSKQVQAITRCRNSVLATSLLLLKAARAKAGAVWKDELNMDTVLTDTPEGRQMVQFYNNLTPAEGSLPDILARARNQDTGLPFENYQIIAQSNTFLLAGYETTSSTLAYAIYQLAQHPAAEAQLLQEVDAFGRGKLPSYEDLTHFPFAEAVVQETLRLMPPAPVVSRLCTQDIELQGWKLPAGTPVHIDIMAVHTDPRYWRQPLQFRPERFLKGSEEAEQRPAYAHMPFGMGPRQCVGYKFALEEAVLALVGLYGRYTFRLDPSRCQAPLKLRQGITLGPAEGVWVTVHSR